MTQRRRFFPSTPVQTVLGRTVELEVQVRPAGVVAAPAPAPVPVDPVLSWVSPDEGYAGLIQRFPDIEYEYGDQYEMRFEIVPSDDSLIHVKQQWRQWPPDVTTGWRGTPWRMTVDDVPLPMTGPGWQCELIECVVSINGDLPSPACYTGCIVGVAPERVTWELAWEPPYEEVPEYEDSNPEVGNIEWGDAASAGGHVARALGCMLMVYPCWKGGSEEARQTLTATALVDGKAVGSLKFVAIHLGW